MIDTVDSSSPPPASSSAPPLHYTSTQNLHLQSPRKLPLGANLHNAYFPDNSTFLSQEPDTFVNNEFAVQDFLDTASSPAALNLDTPIHLQGLYNGQAPFYAMQPDFRDYAVGQETPSELPLFEPKHLDTGDELSKATFSPSLRHSRLSLDSVANTPSVPPIPLGRSTWGRRPSKARTGLMSVKRSQSTPNVQMAAAAAAAAAMSDLIPSDDVTSAAALLDKKRSKLGYHRTSVACVHCRRRKIRCLPAKDDTEKRCSNCIRLKKECNYHPVETTERRPRSASKPEISNVIHPENSNLSSSMSSPSRSPQFGMERLPYHIKTEPITDPGTVGSSHERPIKYRTARHASSSSMGQISNTFSASSSRRPSLAHMYTAPLPSREFRSSSESSPTFPVISASFAERFGERHLTKTDLDEPPVSAFWNIMSTGTSSGFTAISEHDFVDFSMPPLNEHPIHPTSHHRLNSVDDGIEPRTQVGYTGYTNGLADDCNIYSDNATNIGNSIHDLIPHLDSTQSLSSLRDFSSQQWNMSSLNVVDELPQNHTQMADSWLMYSDGGGGSATIIKEETPMMLEGATNLVGEDQQF